MKITNSTNSNLKIGFTKEKLHDIISGGVTNIKPGESGAIQFFIFSNSSVIWFGFIPAEGEYVIKNNDPVDLYRSNLKIPNLLSTKKGGNHVLFVLLAIISLFVVVWFILS